jgi:hypothetical protein
MDQMSALRQIAMQGDRIVSAGAHLFKPGETYAIRAGSMDGTPLPHEEPQLENPPSGVVAYYWLRTGATQPLKLELLDSSGVVRACASSDTPVRPVDTETLNIQAIWVQPPQPPSAAAGMHRYALGGAAGRGFGGFGRGSGPPPAPDACTPSAGATNAQAATPARGPGGGRRGAPSLAPGEYTVRLTVDGQTYSQPVTIKPDPRGLPNGVKDGTKNPEEPSEDTDGG